MQQVDELLREEIDAKRKPETNKALKDLCGLALSASKHMKSCFHFFWPILRLHPTR